jgi:ribosomal protein S18 acetylase RimI-like enzyme
MRRALSREKTLVLDILCRSFEGNAHTNWFISPHNGGWARRQRILIAYCLEQAFTCGEVYLSDDGKATAVWVTGNRKPRFTAGLLWVSLQFIFVLGLKRVFLGTAMERFTHKQWPRPPFAYLWYIGVAPDAQGHGLASELLDPMLARFTEEGLPVLLETSSPANVAVYQHKGFEVYHTETMQDGSELTIYWMTKTAG